MLIYVLMILLIIFLNIFIKNKKNYCFLMTLLLLLIVGLRDPRLGKVDTFNMYLPYYRLISNFSFLELLDFIKKIDSEFLFYFISFICGKMNFSENLYLLIISTPFYVIVGKYIYKHSPYPTVSFLMLLSLNYFGITFYMLRHMLALAFVIEAYEYLRKNENKKFFIFLGIAFLFHRSSMIFLLVFLLKKLKVKKYFYSISCLLLLVIIYLYGNVIFNFIFSIIHIDGRLSYYLTNGIGNNLTTFVINFAILVVMEITFDSNDNESFNDVKMQFIACILSAFVPVLSEFIRLASFFSIFSIVAIPISISKFKHNKNLFIVSLVVILSIYFLGFSIENNAISPYNFFWEVK